MEEAFQKSQGEILGFFHTIKQSSLNPEFFTQEDMLHK